MASSPISTWQIDVETVETVLFYFSVLLFFWAPKSLHMAIAAMKLNFHWKESYDQPRQHIKKQRHYFANKGPSSQIYGFSVVIYGCESRAIKKVKRQRIDAFEV